jgi:D-lactate dehydrogenase
VAVDWIGDARAGVAAGARAVDVHFYEAFAEEQAALKRLLPSTIAAGYTDRTIQESGDASPPARLISVRTQSRLPAAWAPELGGILSRSTGYDHLRAYAQAVREPPALGYLPLYCHRAVAEQAMLLWMALLRRLPRQQRQFKSFTRDGITGRECAGRTLAVVGVGRIGAEACAIGAALGMRVLGVDRAPSAPAVRHVAIEAALAEADVVVCAMDLTAENRGYFSRSRWRQAKPGAVFVNISRGELSPPTALLEALEEGRLAGVALDVYDRESELATALRSGGAASEDPEIQATLRLASREDVICTPHNAFNSEEAVERKSAHSVEQVVAFLATGAFRWGAPA